MVEEYTYLWVKTLSLKSLSLKSLGLMLGVEKYGVEMSYNCLLALVSTIWWVKLWLENSVIAQKIVILLLTQNLKQAKIWMLKSFALIQLHGSTNIWKIPKEMLRDMPTGWFCLFDNNLFSGYDNTGCWVFKWVVLNKKDLLPRINERTQKYSRLYCNFWTYSKEIIEFWQLV